jgi:hypothetical protein
LRKNNEEKEEEEEMKQEEEEMKLHLDLFLDPPLVLCKLC